MIHVGIVGCGHWGPNYIRNFSVIKGCQVKTICDLDTNRLNFLKEIYPTLDVTTDLSYMLEDPEIKAVVVATPSASHFEVVKACLGQRKDVLCEKPLTLHIEEGEELIRLAEEKDSLLMVGHIFVFNLAINKMKYYIREGVLGQIYYMHSKRTNLGPIRNDVNAVWDLSSHDVSIFNFLLDAIPQEVSARGAAYLQKDIMDMAFITMSYPKEILVNIHVSWLDPRKVRQITVVGDNKMLTWDDLSAIGPICLYDKGVSREPYYQDYGEFHLLAREGDVTFPKISQLEPLRIQCQTFIQGIQERRIEKATGREGLEAVRVLSAIQKSIDLKGAPVKV
jgi:predicted dehydrogenase